MYQPAVGKYTSLPQNVISGVVENMNKFIINNANTGLFSNCVGVLDNDPSPETASAFYKAASYLDKLATNNILQSVQSLNEFGEGILVTTNRNLNIYYFRIAVIDPNGIVLFDSASPNSPVNPQNHFCRSDVLQALLYEGTDIKTFNLYKYSYSTTRMQFYASARIGSLTDPIGVLRISADVTYK